MNIKDIIKRLNRDIPAIFIALKKKETPALAKIFAAITVGYALSPIDLIPDFIPVLGYLDDIVILPLLVVITIKLIPDKIIISSRDEANNIWSKGKPKKWYYDISIILIWCLIIFIIIRLFVKN